MAFNRRVADTVYNKLSEFELEEEFMPVILCESGFNPGITNTNDNKTVDHGLFQFNSKSHPKGNKAWTIDEQVDYAKQVYENNELKDWKWSKECWTKVKNTL